MITWKKNGDFNSWYTQNFGNLLSDTFQGSVSKDEHDGTWDAWVMNLSRGGKHKYKLGFKTKAPATRWVNQKLKEMGIK